MKELRKQNIVHRDIKPQNILVKQRDDKKYLVRRTRRNFVHVVWPLFQLHHTHTHHEA